MPHYGTLHDYRFENADDVRGAEVYGVNNEKLGTVDDVIFDHSTGDIRYVVVDAGGWLTSRKFLVPLSRIQPYGSHEDKFYAELDKERIQMLPEFNEDMLKSEVDWNDYENRYEQRWKEGTLLYNESTGRVVTPPSEQVAGTRTSALTEQGKQSLQRDFTPEKLGQRDDLWGVASSGDDVTLRPKKASIAGREDAILAEKERSAEHAKTENVPEPPLHEPTVYKLDPVPPGTHTGQKEAGYGRRWVGFQEKVRQGRDKVVQDCPLCGTQKKVA